MADPVSWIVIERGWQVRDRDGNAIGKVDEVTGDENADIFDGVTVTGGMRGRPRYVPSERVAEIRAGVVILDVGGDEVEKLTRPKEPASGEHVRPQSSTWYRRLVSRTVGRRR